MYRSESYQPMDRSLLLILLAVMLGLQAACARTDQISHYARNDITAEEVDVGTKLSLSVEITSFQPQAIHDDFVGGVSKSYDLTLLTIIEPGPYGGTRLQITHPSGLESEPKWTSVGKRCLVIIEEWLLAHADLLIPRESVQMTCTKNE